MTRKKTHEEYVAEVAIVNPDIEVVGTYVNNSTKILHRCKIDGYEWNTRPSGILLGCGCPKCSGKAKKTHQEYIDEAAKINPNIEVIGEYVNTNTKILHRCKIDGYEWMISPHTILCGHGCPVCNGGVKKTHKQYVEDVATVNPNIDVLGVYVNSSTKILHRCKIDGYEWMVKPNDILNGYGCPRCSGNERYTQEEYVKRVASIAYNIEVIGTYIDNKTKILHKCKIDGYEWYAVPNNILNGHGCPVCGGVKRRTHEEYVVEVALINRDIEVVGRYVNAHTSVLHKCKLDGCEWAATPSNILRGVGCPKCNQSKGEKTISAWLDKNNILYKPQETFDGCRDKRLLRFDFHLLDYGILIEYNGKQHYEPVEFFGGQKGFEARVRRDRIKVEYCKNNNIPLIVIPYYADIYEELDKLYEFIKMQDVIKEVA